MQLIQSFQGHIRSLPLCFDVFLWCIWVFCYLLFNSGMCIGNLQQYQLCILCSASAILLEFACSYQKF